jgi:serine/threonine protein kinase
MPDDADSADDFPIVPGYVLLEKIASSAAGGFLFRARQLANGRTVALELSPPRLDDRLRARLRFEVEGQARLNHPNIEMVYEFGESGGRIFCAREWCGGDTLARRLGPVPGEPRESARLVETLARVVHYAHRCGVLHRHLKPDNIRFTTDGTPKVAAFSGPDIDRIHLEFLACGAILGTPAYMAPEQARGGKAWEIGPPADVYALGILLYQGLTGRVPFQGATPLETLELQIRRPPTPPRRLNRTVPHDLETICLKCLEKQPQRRYASAETLAEDLERFLSGAPPRSRPSPVRRLLRWLLRG